MIVQTGGAGDDECHKSTYLHGDQGLTMAASVLMYGTNT